MQLRRVAGALLLTAALFAQEEPKAPVLTAPDREAYHVALEHVLVAEARANAIRDEIREKLAPALAAEWKKLVTICGSDPVADDSGLLQCKAPAK